MAESVKQTAKNTRVKARVKAEALREFITGKERVIVMGHKMADVVHLVRQSVFTGQQVRWKRKSILS